MDCDGTHNPVYIKKLISLSSKNQIVLTNRFIRKSGIEDWTFWRKILTIIRHFIVKFVLNIKYDSSGAYRCYDAKKVKLKHNIEPDPTRPELSKYRGGQIRPMYDGGLV